MEKSTSRSAEMLLQQKNLPPPLNLIIQPPPALYAHHLHSSAANYARPQNPNPNPNLDYAPYAAHRGLDPNLTYPIASGPEPHQLGLTYAYPQTAASTITPYYQDPNAAVVQLAVPYGAGVTIPPTVKEKQANQTVGSQRKKGQKKIKVVQSAWCQVCKIDCNSKSVLDQHKLGKKHKKNLEKLIIANTSATAPALAPAAASTSVPTAASTVSDNPIIGPQENPDKASASGQKAKKKAAGVEDLETKKRKILEGGAAAEAVRMCALCNVVCNSETVFRFHLAGQKHAAMVKKHASATGIAAAT